jgi:hypothetical protein
VQKIVLSIRLAATACFIKGVVLYGVIRKTEKPFIKSMK